MFYLGEFRYQMDFLMDLIQALAFPFIPAVSHGHCPASTMLLSLPDRVHIFFSSRRKNIFRNHAYEMLIISILFLRLGNLVGNMGGLWLQIGPVKMLVALRQLFL